MIINGFGGSERTQGQMTLLQTVTGTISFSYNSTIEHTNQGNAGIISNTGQLLNTSTTLNIPSPATYYGLGYNCIKYVPSVTTTKLSSGNVIFAGSRLNTTYNYGVAIGVDVEIFGVHDYLLGVGSTKFAASEVSTSNSYTCGHLVNYSPLTWTLYHDVKGGGGNYDTPGSTYILTEETKSKHQVFHFVGSNGEGTVTWALYNTTSPSYTTVWSPTIQAYLRGGCAEGYNQYSSEYGGMWFRPSMDVRRSDASTVTLTATPPPAISVRVDVYGIS